MYISHIITKEFILLKKIFSLRKIFCWKYVRLGRCGEEISNEREK